MSNLTTTTWWVLSMQVQWLACKCCAFARAYGGMHTHVRHAQVATSPPWFKALTWLELLFQTPYLLHVGPYLSHAEWHYETSWLSGRSACRAIWGFTFKEEWIRAPSIVYGASACTAMVPILAELLQARNPTNTKLALAGFYAPFTVMPLLVLIRSFRGPMFSTVRTHQKWL